MPFFRTMLGLMGYMKWNYAKIELSAKMEMEE
jgi:hypothetical protein